MDLPRMLVPLTLSAVAVAADAGSLDYPSVWVCDRAKFNWYCDVEQQAEAESDAQQPSAALPRVELRDLRTAEQMRLELKRREDIAVMMPTDDNVKAYLELWQLVQDKGAVFADAWRRVVWQNPELDYSLRRPTNNSAIKTLDAGRQADEEAQIRRLAQDHGLIFFFRSDCPYCHAMAPLLKKLSAKYGIEVLPVSIDGKGIPDYPSPRDGRASARAWAVERVPALFIGSKRTGDHAPIGFGAMSLSEIVQRIFILTGTKAGDTF